MNNLSLRTPAHVSLAGSRSVADMATMEGWDPEKYALVLASTIRNWEVPLQVQTERLAALAGIGGALSPRADEAAATVLSQHLAVIEALHQRFAHQAFISLSSGGNKSVETASRALDASIKAQRACLAILSALRVLRSTAPTAPSLEPAGELEALPYPAPV